MRSFLESLRPHALLLYCAGGVLVLDRLAKKWVEHSVPLFASVDVIGEFFRITHVRNTGIAFGLFSGMENILIRVLLVFLSLLALGVVLHLYRNSEKSRFEQVSMGLIIGGAFGNLFDRFFYRYVTDFLDIGIAGFRWYTFNLADVFIFSGLFVWAFQSWMKEKRIREV